MAGRWRASYGGRPFLVVHMPCIGLGGDVKPDTAPLVLFLSLIIHKLKTTER